MSSTPTRPRPGLSPSGHVDTFARDHLPPAEQWPVLEFTTPDLQYPERLNAAVELLDETIRTHGPDRPALRTPDGTVWTYGELLTRTNQVAAVLTEDLGLVPGNRVLLRAPNTPWTVAAWLGTLKAGGVVVTTMAALRARELGPIVEKTQPSVALVDHRFVEDVHAVRDTVAPDLVVVPYAGDSADDLTRRAATKSGEFEAVDTAADDVALFGPTSGSTGVPKITTHFQRDILSIDNTFGRHVLRLEADDVVACTAPFAFTFGLGMLVVFPLRAGACALLTEAATPVQLAEIVEEHGVTVLATAPTAYKQVIKSGNLGRLRGLRKAVSAGEHIAQDVWETIHHELGLKVIDGIGATEMLHIFISAAGDDIRAGSTGRPVPGYRATILGPDDRPVPPGTEGRLAVIGPVGCRYLDDERQLGYVVDGWNVTGDTFVQDEDGYFFYRARTDSMIVSSGYNIGAPEVEAAIDAHPDVVEVGVVGEPDAERGSIVSAFVVLREGVVGDDAKVREIQDHVKATLAPYKYPRRVRFVDRLPRNTSGKLQHFKLREQAQHAQADPADTAGAAGLSDTAGTAGKETS
ncbi:AMP-binding protein [Phycicoccus sp. M110.8]|uniref:AMP-binding protein n=1 Tax=Phycicoccus sp. M110.8 TaxID=3075433 RepID=UPI0028FD8D0E|nr:AMP-binding protein [Phycicoccus sp. M110.8]MDU0314033.1 AMP-binding protein [Phycicoccus sp. M110.8]